MYSISSRPFNSPQNLLNYCPLSEHRWDRQNIQLIWEIDEYKILTFDVVTGVLDTVIDFEIDPALSTLINAGDVYRITMNNEGETSRDKRYWAFILQGNSSVDYRPGYIFTWDRTLDSVLGVYEVSALESDIDWAGMSWLGNYVLIGDMSDNTGNLVGLTSPTKNSAIFTDLITQGLTLIWGLMLKAMKSSSCRTTERIS
ncbi:hypothetical protein JXA84_03155 [candidate division WOR-3 bacterium]|nr:hypothetical protein [candidate division WOR-3 bacterium]